MLSVNNLCPKTKITPSHRSIPQSAVVGWYCLVLAGPRWRRVAQEAQRAARTCAELETPTGGDGESVFGADFDGGYRCWVGVR